MRVPVVMLAWRGDPGTAAPLIRAGPADFLTKDGLTPERLEHAVRGEIRVVRGEREAATTREPLATTLRRSADAVVTLHIHGRISYLSPVAGRLLGWSAPHGLGRPLEDAAFVMTAGRGPAGLRESVLSARVQRVLRAARRDERADMKLGEREGAALFVDDTVTALRSARGSIDGA